MKNPKYPYKSEQKFKHFEFISEGPKGLIRKMVEYTETGNENVYNLGFGDYDEKTGNINDKIVTNNGDSLKVLSTVVSTLYAFTAKYPNAKVFATGTSESRTRLYRMGISNNLEELKQDFLVYGLKLDETFEEFIVGEDYLGFLVKRKKKIKL